MDNNLEILKDITSKLPLLSNLIIERSNKYIKYKNLGGFCDGTSLLNKNEIAIQDAFMPKGNVFPAHLHDVNEIVIVYEGSLEVKTNKIIVMNKGDLIKFEPNTLHLMTALEDTYMIGITIPSSPNYPKE